MTVYYYQNGFLHTDGTPPEGAVALTAAEHEALVVGQCAGQIVMPGKDGKPVLAPLAPCPSSTWDGEQWQIDPECAARLKAEQQDEMWERIKDKRYDNLRHGVYAKSVGKWFQTDDATRLQYLALALESVTGGFKKPINWKTMDNSFLMLTPELLREIMQAMHDDEQADFINAEKHKAAMLKSENPLEYDYSGGWTANYEQSAAELEEAEK